MGYSYKQSKEMFGEARAKQLFDSVGVNTKVGRQAKPKRELTEKEYMKLKEDDHGKLLKTHIEDNYPNIKFTHIGNESGQGGTRNIIIMMAKKKALGVSKGFPDYIISIPNGTKGKITLYLELKKAKGPQGGWNGSVIAEEQCVWLNELQNNICCFCEIGHGSRQAIEIFERYVNQFKDLSNKDSFDTWWQKDKKDFMKLLATTK